MDLSGRSIYVMGRLPGLTRARLRELLTARGARLLPAIGSRADAVCMAHSSAATRLSENGVELPAEAAGDCQFVSELSFRRSIGLLPPLPDEDRSTSEDDLARRARLPRDTVLALSFFDVLQPVDEQFSYRDLVAAREVGRLLAIGFPLLAIVQATFVLRRSGRGLSDTRLQEAAWGEMLQEVAGRAARLNGQYELPLLEQASDADALFIEAEELEVAGDLSSAERLYRALMQVDRQDPVIPFNLGNVLGSQGRREEAAHAYLQALSRDSTFADAWVNLGVLNEAANPSTAERSYVRALTLEPEHPLGLFNLALLLTHQGCPRRALPYWDRYLATKPTGGDLLRARRLAALCRMQGDQTPPNLLNPESANG
jgi:tetratricopeptide (TPR) repeat protein